MGHYNQATICLNGHVMSSYNANEQKYCSICGAETISVCPTCHAPLRGSYEADGIVMLGGHYHKDNYCYNCGKPYPWTETILNSAVELLSLDDELNTETKEILKNAIPDLIVNEPSPKTDLAVARYKKFIPQVQSFVSDGLRQLLVDVVSSTVRKSLFPQ